MKVTELMEQAHATAAEKGWHDKPRSIAEEIALFHSELSEALECIRNGDEPDAIWHDGNGKPCGFAVELADVLIRIAESCQHRGVPLEKALILKLAYNKSREYRHGKKL
jgi:NTP pyrophosphatase (non-canonical NTP hydrolase)